MLKLKKSLNNRIIIFLILSSTGLMRVDYAQPSPSSQSNSEFFMTVRVDTKERPVEGLTKNDFIVSLDNKPVEIAEIIEENKPLAMVVIVVLGVDGKCEFEDFARLSAWLDVALSAGKQLPKLVAAHPRSVPTLSTPLSSQDQIAVAVTNKEGELLLKFDDSADEWSKVLGDGMVQAGNSKLTSISEEQSVSCAVARREKGSVLDGDFDGKLSPGFIRISPNNYLAEAFKTSLNYLRKARNPEARPVVLIANNIYNINEFYEIDEREIMGSIKQEGVTVNWIGEPDSSTMTKNIPLQKSCASRPNKRISFFQDLPKITGGTKLPCSMLANGYLGAQRRNIKQRLELFFASLRHSYSIKLAPSLTKAEQSRLDVKLVSKRAKGTTITYSKS